MTTASERGWASSVAARTRTGASADKEWLGGSWGVGVETGKVREYVGASRRFGTRRAWGGGASDEGGRGGDEHKLKPGATHDDLPVNVCTNPLKPENFLTPPAAPTTLPPLAPPTLPLPPPFRAWPYGVPARPSDASFENNPIFVSFAARAFSRSRSLRVRCVAMSGDACRGGAVATRASGAPNSSGFGQSSSESGSGVRARTIRGGGEDRSGMERDGRATLAGFSALGDARTGRIALPESDGLWPGETGLRNPDEDWSGPVSPTNNF